MKFEGREKEGTESFFYSFSFDEKKERRCGRVNDLEFASAKDILVQALVEFAEDIEMGAVLNFEANIDLGKLLCVLFLI